jgi:hypothetical protein
MNIPAATLEAAQNFVMKSKAYTEGLTWEKADEQTDEEFRDYIDKLTSQMLCGRSKDLAGVKR